MALSPFWEACLPVLAIPPNTTDLEEAINKVPAAIKAGMMCKRPPRCQLLRLAAYPVAYPLEAAALLFAANAGNANANNGNIPPRCVSPRRLTTRRHRRFTTFHHSTEPTSSR